MKFKRALPPESIQPLRVVHINCVQLDLQRRTATVDGRPRKLRTGCWMFYLPELEMKLFHAANGMIDCVHASRPDENILQQPAVDLGSYTSDDWRRALSTPLSRRLAEVWTVSVLLWRAGLGPQPLGVCFVQRLCRDQREQGPTCGLLTQNVYSLPRKLPCRIEQVRQAGVIPDRIKSCVRQQLRGYVTDVCSVVGCMPDDKEQAVNELEDLLRNASDSDLLSFLNGSMA